MATSAMLKKMIGKTSETIGFEIERGQIRRFAKAIGESNPIHYDVEAAASAGYDNLVAPPTFPSALHGFDDFYKLLGLNPHALMHQEEEYEFFKPIFAGDEIKVVHSVVNAYDKALPNGRLIYIVIETRGGDKRSRPVFKGRRVLVELER